jgi:SAM-dependent methyltransferase
MKFYARLLGLGEGDKKIEWLLPYVKRQNVLDLGCVGEGEGAYYKDNWIHAHLAAAANYCLGLDNNNEAIYVVNSQGYNAIVGDAQDFTCEHPFDVVVAADILEHLHDWKGFFNSVRGALKQDGLLLITIPNAWFLLRFLRCILKGDGGVHPEHVAWFCSGSIIELIKRYGFEVDDIRFGSCEPILYRFSKYFWPVLCHTSIFVVARKKPD